jgi:hypothetical protein
VRRAPTGWRDAPARLLGGVPQGAQIAALAAGADDDLWAVSTCRPYPEDGRGVSLVSAFHGDFGGSGDRIPSVEALVLPVEARDIVVRPTDTGRTVWVAGDWSTLLSLRYRPGEPIPSARPSPAADLRCTASLAGGQ